MHIVLSGSSGLIGTALISALQEAGHRVTRLVRPATTGAIDGILWDPAQGTIDATALEGVDAVVNLSGRSIGDRRWTPAEKELIRSSRVGPTRLLAETLAGLERKPLVFVSASAIGFYGGRGDEVLDEDSAVGRGFFADVCRQWEDASLPAADAGIRTVQVRTGIVLSGRGGALGRLLAPFGPKWLSPYRWGLGGWVGGGGQWWSWISIEDQVRGIVHLLDGSLSGPVNLTAPEPATNKGFMKAVGRALRRPVLLPIPRFVFKLVLGSELAEATLFDSQRVAPSRLLSDGFVFRDPDLGGALIKAIEKS
jgi:uncharacterized protein (TIGR01777 family)